MLIVACLNAFPIAGLLQTDGPDPTHAKLVRLLEQSFFVSSIVYEFQAQILLTPRIRQHAYPKISDTNQTYHT